MENDKNKQQTTIYQGEFSGQERERLIFSELTCFGLLKTIKWESKMLSHNLFLITLKVKTGNDADKIEHLRTLSYVKGEKPWGDKLKRIE